MSAATFMISEAYTYAMGAHKSCNGRAAFFHIIDQYLRQNDMGHMTIKAERKLSTIYHGEK